jgi:hypothetical protein
MVRKVVLGALLVGLIGVLVVGAVFATGGKNVAEARGQGQGRGAGGAVEEAAPGAALNESATGQGNGRRGGYAQGASPAERQYPNYKAAPEDWVLYAGTVMQTPAAGVDLVIRTGSGEEVVVGTGPGYLEDQGLMLQAGEPVQVQGYWEDGEFKAAQVTRLQDGQTVTLRDEVGRPAWAGVNRQASEQPAAAATGTQSTQEAQSPNSGQGRGRGRQGSGQGGYGGGEVGTPLIGGELSESESAALLMALGDEYRAWSVCEQVIADFGAVRPFTSIQKAEENHIAALVTLFDGYGLEVPANEWQGNVATFDTLAEACEAGVQAEIDNAGLYDQLFSMVENPDLIRVFTALQRASQDQHLPAFERCAP